MAIKTFINGQENGVITYKGDTEPYAVYVNGEKQDNISYVPQEVTGENSVEYSSEYKKNVRTMQIDGNTVQEQRAGGDELPLFDLKDWNDLNLPQLESPDLGTTYTSCIYWSLPINYEQGVFDLWLDYMETLSDQELNIVIAYTTDDLINRTGSYKVLYPYTKPVIVDQPFYIGAINPNGNIDETDGTMWQKYINAIYDESVIHFTTVASPSPYAPSPIQNAGHLLPPEYQQVEYIESTGTQYIDTGFKPNQNTKVEVKSQYISTTAVSIFGSNPYFVLTTISGKYRFRYNSATRDTSISGTELAKLTLDKNKAYLNDGLVGTFTEATFQSPYNALLFARSTESGGVEEKCSAKLYYAKLWDNNVLIRDYVPCYRKSDNVIGLYDLVNNVFYTNQGTGTFLKGADVNKGIECVLRGKNLIDLDTISNLENWDSQDISLGWRFYYLGLTAGKTYSVSRIQTGLRADFEHTPSKSSSISITSSRANAGVFSVITNSLGYSSKTFVATGEEYLFLYAPTTFASSQQVALTNMLSIITEFQLEESDTPTPYEPYFHKTLSLPSSVTVDGQEVELRFGRIEKTGSGATNGKADYLLIDRLSNKVSYVQNTMQIDISQYPINYRGIAGQQNHNLFAITVPSAYMPQPYYFRGGIGLCNNANWLYSGAEPKTNLTGTRFQVGEGKYLYYFIPINEGITSVALFKEWLANHETIVLYALETPLEYDLTETEIGQQILDFVNSTQNATNIIEITSTPSVSNLSVNYAKWGGTPNANNT